MTPAGPLPWAAFLLALWPLWLALAVVLVLTVSDALSRRSS